MLSKSRQLASTSVEEAHVVATLMKYPVSRCGRAVVTRVIAANVGICRRFHEETLFRSLRFVSRRYFGIQVEKLRQVVLSLLPENLD